MSEARRRGWTQKYYDAIRDYTEDSENLIGQRSPSKVNRLLAEKAPPVPMLDPAAIFARLQRIEVPLNHLLAQFFELAPPQWIATTLSGLVGAPILGSPRCSDHSIHDIGLSRNFIQPDLFISSDNAAVSVEVKLASASSVDQVLKYAVLHAEWEQFAGSQLRHALVFLTQKPIEHTLAEGKGDVAVVRARCRQVLSTDTKVGDRIIAGAARAKVLQIIENTVIVRWTFPQLASAVSELSRSAAAAGPLAASAQRLSEGLLEELEARGLVGGD